MQQKVRYEGVAAIDIPLGYRCSKCGKENIANIYLVENSYQSDAKEAARTEAYCNLMDKVNEFYSVEPIEHMGKIEGKCEDCGNVEPWMVSPEKMKKNRSMENVLPAVIFFGLLAAGWISAVVLGINPVITIIACFALLIIALKALSTANSKKRQAREREQERERRRKIEAIPVENRPKYILKERDVIESLKKKMNGKE